MTTKRRLTPLEKTLTPDFISQDIDLDKVTLHNRPWTFLTPRRYTVVRGWNIYWPDMPDEATQLWEQAHLVHELTHVWQYIHLGVGLYSPKWLNRRYSYHLTRGNRFEAFGMEQQASIVEDSFRISHGLQSRHALNPITTDLMAHIIPQSSTFV